MRHADPVALWMVSTPFVGGQQRVSACLPEVDCATSLSQTDTYLPVEP